jgi:hypothetical protein
MDTKPDKEPNFDASAGKKQAELLRRRETKRLLPHLPVWRDYRAWFSSCIVHTLLFVSIAFLWQPRSRGTGDTVERPIGIALVRPSNDKDEYFLTGGAAAQRPENSTQTSSAAAAAVVDGAGPPVSVNELLSDLVGSEGAATRTGDPANGTGEGLAGLGTGTSGTASGPAKSTASFMGLKGSGTSFVYVLDRSASMLEFDGAPMRYAKRELLKSIQSLSDKNQFQIVFYNEAPGSLNPGTAGGRLLQANELNRDRATRFVQAIAPQGGTEHIPGLKMGLSFSPDVVFFLTDAAEPAMSESQLLEIQSRAERSLTTIHTIQFNRGPETNDGGWIRDLAEMNRGTYRYVDILTIE